jgi:hypothetical protein
MKVLYPFFIFKNQETYNLLNLSYPMTINNFLLLKSSFRRFDESFNLLSLDKITKTFLKIFEKMF